MTLAKNKDDVVQSVEEATKNHKVSVGSLVLYVPGLQRKQQQTSPGCLYQSLLNLVTGNIEDARSSPSYIYIYIS